ncbi:uncharacterized protein APUU_50106S [Aspergillus puulaauensis]|uniref:Uncharacterized protein n=1 Tax=Aspergillus puulaauensis TaxID=1220207 RepID=A0A7R7XPR2_9EURO|nr:uncharacterized protein APUU_50106S [Aspergillus puulaauensis]BCS25395.1 hypothetical protein APUU_50106S [Aspergillus puulaauensis]
MPLFHRDSMSSSSRSSIDDPNTHTHTRHKTGLFGQHTHSATSGHNSASSSGARRSSHSHNHGHRSGHHGLFRTKNHEDPAISAARDRAFHAEEAEQAADKALYASRLAVQDARNNVKELERDAKEESRLAKLKQREARDISKRVKPLGRK